MSRFVRRLIVSLVIASILLCVVFLSVAAATATLDSRAATLAFIVTLFCVPLIPWIASFGGPRGRTPGANAGR